MLRLFAYQSFWFFQIDAANDFNKYTLILNRTFEPTVFIKTPDPPPPGTVSWLAVRVPSGCRVVRSGATRPLHSADRAKATFFLVTEKKRSEKEKNFLTEPRKTRPGELGDSSSR